MKVKEVVNIILLKEVKFIFKLMSFKFIFDDSSIVYINPKECRFPKYNVSQ